MFGTVARMLSPRSETEVISDSFHVNLTSGHGIASCFQTYAKSISSKNQFS